MIKNIYLESKPRYDILDGLRGVAACMVLLYHLFEAIAFAAGAPEQQMFNGFLGVDFFFVLSGFVMGYAYDERWDRMSVKDFIKRRLIRLHPMVVMGVFIGVIAFFIQGCEKWDGSHVSLSMLMLATLSAMFLLPAQTGMDVRGNTEMFPINGPHWSLFFEYIGSLLYALMLHRLVTKALKIWVTIAAVALLAIGMWGPDGSIAYGWSSQPINMFGGFLRLMFAYPAGLLMARMFRQKQPARLKAPMFLLCSVALIALMNVPSFHNVTLNVIYQVCCVVFFFPLIIWYGARGSVGGFRQRCVSFLGRLSYPLYAIHYPFIYLYIDWINKDIHPFGPHPLATPVAVAIISLLTATLCVLLYDEPIRKWLACKFLK